MADPPSAISGAALRSQYGNVCTPGPLATVPVGWVDQGQPPVVER